MSCEQFEIAVERRAHGALAPDESAQLDAHLAECDGCRAFAGSAHALADSLARHTRAQLGGIDMDRLRGNLESLVRQRRARLFGAIAFAAVWMSFFGWWMSAIEPSRRAQWFPALFTVMWLVPYFRWLTSRQANEAEKIVRGDGDMLAWWRSHVDQSLRGFRFLLWLAPVGVVALIGINWALHEPGTERAFALGAIVAGVTGVAVVGWAVGRRAQLKRERLSLG